MKELKASLHKSKQTDTISDAEISANRDNLPPNLTCSESDILSASICKTDIVTSEVPIRDRKVQEEESTSYDTRVW